jgi:hypothetical protein
MYDRVLLKKVLSAKSIVAAADTVLYTWTLPSNAKSFTLQRVFQEVTTAMGGTTLGQIKIYRTPSGGSALLLKTCSAFGLTSAAGVAREDEVVNISTCSNKFHAGDTLEIQVAVTATSTGSIDVYLELGYDV